MVFFSENFTFNNIHSRDMNISLISLEGDILNDYGISYNENIVSESINNKNFISHILQEVTTHGVLLSGTQPHFQRIPVGPRLFFRGMHS